MDFLDPKKQRRLSIQLFAGYILVAIMILLATTILIYYAYGFGVNRQGDLVQKGLVFVSSQPSGADLYVNDKRVASTNAKLNLAAGQHTLNIKRDGYRDWRRTISVEGGDVSHYVYPLLLPSKLEPRAIKTYDAAPALVTQSPDRRWLASLKDVTVGTFEVMDLNRNQDTIAEMTDFSVPAGLLSASVTTPRWELMEWSSNNRHMLLKRYYTAQANTPETFEYILADRQRPEGSYNLSRELGVTPSELSLRDKKPDAYYLYDAASKELSTASLGEPTLVRLLTDVLAYKTHGSDTILYVTSKGAKDGTVTAKFRQGTREHTVRQLPVSQVYLLDAARFDGDWYAVVGAQAENRVFIYKNPHKPVTDAQFTNMVYALRLDAPTSVSFSANAQFVMAQNGETFHLYDLDKERSYRYRAHYPLDPPQSKALWMDGNRITYVSGGKQVVFDYDNINRRSLVDASPTYLSAFDREYRFLYSFTTQENGSLTLSATPLRTEADL